jgi:hypothetical protein
MSDDFTLKIKRYAPTDARLGRHVVHDSRSLRYLAPARDPATLQSVRHHVNIGVMDQGNLGSCTGHAGTNAIASDPFWSGGSLVLATTDPHDYAVGLYSEATKLDPWPGEWEPDDTGSDGLSVAKALLARGLVSGYTHATSLAACLTAVAERVPIVGTNWTSSMFEPDSSGRIRPTGSIEGGHEFALDELDVNNERVWIRNSWGPSWGQEGRAYLVWDDLGTLLAADGDCTILIPKSEPAPVPVPVPPKPKDAALAAALAQYLRNRNAARYMRDAATPWLADFNKENP